jgi:KUP system potassium uptake protein
VVYGDIGTSPLYALRECFNGPHAVALTRANVLGVLSLIFWSLVLVISVKYLLLALQADNHGEGGILALMASSARHGRAPGAGPAGSWWPSASSAPRSCTATG